MNVVILSPHSDDETLGMGGTAAKHVLDGDVVTVVLLSRHRDNTRHDEFISACDVLGANPHELFEPFFLDGELDENFKSIVSAIDDINKNLRPDYLYIPYPSQHQDHRAVYEAGVAASRISLNPRHFHIKNLLVYSEPVSEIEMYETGLRMNYFVDISGEPLARKLSAIKCHASQNLPSPSPSNAEFLLAEATTTGGSVGMVAAERFSVLRYSA